MKIEFGKIIDDKSTEQKCLYWYKENLKTIELLFHDCSISYKTLYSSDKERIYFINDETFAYVGIVSKYFDDGEYENNSLRGYGAIGGYIKRGNCIDVSMILVCELNYSSFKGIHKSVFEKVSANSGVNNQWIGYPDIIHNYPYFSDYVIDYYLLCLNHCKELIKEYDLEKLLNDFDGVPYCVALYRIEGKDGQFGYSTYCINNIEKAHDFARKCIKNYLPYCLDFSKRPYKDGLTPGCPFDLLIDDTFKATFQERLYENGSPLVDVKDIFQYISYCLINVNDKPKFKYVDNKLVHLSNGFGGSDTQYLCKVVLNNALEDKYNNNDYFFYSDGKIKWKSEYLVYQIIKSHYPNQTIYQYRPLFLKTDKGQLSYDVFITGLNIAVEYQGKQHFSPVEFFGGEAAYESNKQRDELKAKLSQKNSVSLIYFDYTETISEELILKKINEAINNK